VTVSAGSWEISKGTFATISLLCVFLLGTEMCSFARKPYVPPVELEERINWQRMGKHVFFDPERSMVLLHVHEHIYREHASVLWLVFQTVSLYFTKSSPFFSGCQASMFIFCYIASKFNSLTVLNLSHIEFLVFVVNRLGNQLDSERDEKEAEVQKVMEELESEKTQKEAQVQKVMKLESEKAQKEVQVQKVMEENVRLHAMLDKKEAQLQAMSEQCKFMALNHHY